MGLIIALSTLSSSLIFSIKLFIFEVVPSIYLQMFTPLHLFLLLNLLIISILAITHLHKEAVSPSLTPPHTSSSLSGPRERRFRANYASNQDKLFSGIMLNEHDAAANHFMVDEDHLSVQNLAAKNMMASRSDQLRSKRGERAIDCADPATRAVINEVIRVEAPRRKDNGGDDGALESKKADGLISDYDNPGDLQAGNQAVISKFKKASGAEIDELKAECSNHKLEENDEAAEHADKLGSDFLISEPTSSLDPATQEQERPLASTRFTSKKATTRMHMDMLRSNSPLKISRPMVKRGDTLDATWKAICDNKLRHSSPLTRQHKTSYTKMADHHMHARKIGDNNVSKGSPLSPLSPSKQRHHLPTSSSNGLMKKRELSIPREELNARVESFISRFNQQIRIQREESLLNYRNMVARGAK